MPYITYLQDPESHTNAATTYPGYGETREESVKNSRYYNNQQPWVRTVAASRAPAWARRQARDSRWHELQNAACVRELTAEEMRELDAYESQAWSC